MEVGEVDGRRLKDGCLEESNEFDVIQGEEAEAGEKRHNREVELDIPALVAEPYLHGTVDQLLALVPAASYDYFDLK